MEMHQVRYFLAVARTLNFTRAADECHVSQPSLSRAIKLLEGELGGDLFRRERPQAQLTSLGTYMLPLLRQCYESATGARALAQAIKKRSVGSLAVALSRSVDAAIVMPYLAALQRQFAQLQIRLLRGTGEEVVEILKEGEAELAVGVSIEEAWDRLDRWPLFAEAFRLVVSHDHRLANRPSIDFDELRGERLVLRPYCEATQALLAVLRERGLDFAHCDEIATDDDLVALLGHGLGIAIAPAGTVRNGRLTGIPIDGLELQRTVSLFGVSGRQRTAAASVMMKLLRGADWPDHGAETAPRGLSVISLP
jgi:DNA-binding transcriptional LysR family regulator